MAVTVLLLSAVAVASTLSTISITSVVTSSTVPVKVIAVRNSTTFTATFSTVVIPLTVSFVKSFVLLIMKVTLLTAPVAVIGASLTTSVTFSTNSSTVVVALTLSNIFVITGTTVPIEPVTSIDVGDCAVATLLIT